MTQAATARALLAAERQKERDSHLSGWGDNTLPVEIEAQEDVTFARAFRPSVDLIHWRGDLSDFIAWRDEEIL